MDKTPEKEEGFFPSTFVRLTPQTYGQGLLWSKEGGKWEEGSVGLDLLFLRSLYLCTTPTEGESGS